MIINKHTPHFGVGRGAFRPEAIVLHIIDGSQGSCDNWFANPVSKVSAHYSVGFNGEVHQYVQEKDTAWANGRVQNPTFTLYKPNVNPNLYTLSIEHEGKNLALAPDTQINATVELIRAMATRWAIPIDREHIIGHYQIFAGKPNCPSVDKSIIDKIVERAKLGGVSLKAQIKQKVAELEQLVEQL